MGFDRAGAEALAIEASRVFYEGLGGFVAAAAAEAAAEKSRLAEEARELDERREKLREEWRALSEARTWVAEDARAEAQIWLKDEKRCQKATENSDEDAEAEAVAEARLLRNRVEVSERLASVELEKQNDTQELQVRVAALESLRSELANSSNDEARAAADLSRLREELKKMEEEQSRLKTSMFQRSCEIADCREDTGGDISEAEVKATFLVPAGHGGNGILFASGAAGGASVAAPKVAAASIPPKPPVHPGAMDAPNRESSQKLRRSTSSARSKRSSGTATPASGGKWLDVGEDGARSRRSSGRSTPTGSARRLQLCEETLSGASSPMSAQMALSRARRDLAEAQQRHGRESVEALRAAGDLALQLEEASGATEEVGRLLQATLSGLERLLGLDHLETLRAANNVAVFLDNAGDGPEALPLYRRAAEGRRAQLGKEHPHTLDSVYNLALFLQNCGEFDEAEAIFREVRAGCVATFGASHRSSLDCTERLIEVLGDTDFDTSEDEHTTFVDVKMISLGRARRSERVRLCRSLYEGQQAHHGPNHPDVLRAILLLLEALRAEPGSATEKEVEQIHRDAIRRHEEAFGLDDSVTVELTLELAASLLRSGNSPQAEEVLTKAHAAAEKALGPDSHATLSYDDELAVALANDGRLSEADPIFRRALSVRRKALGPWHEETLRSEHNLAVLLDTKGEHDDAGRYYREVYRGRSQVLGEAHPKTVEATYNLAVFLHDHGEGFASMSEAVQLFLKAQLGIEAQFGPDDERLAACVDRLASLRQGHLAI